MLDQEIGELVGKVERTKSLLTFASNLYLHEQTLDQLATLMNAQQNTSSLAVQALAGPNPQQPPGLSSSHSHSPSSTDEVGSDIANRSKSTHMRKAGDRRYLFHVSPWLLQCAWTLTAQRAYSGWMVSLHCHGRLPHDHPAAFACLEGDCSKMQSLLDAGQVSPHDEVRGRSLAQLAAFAGHLPMIRLLCSVGADMRINSRDSTEVSMGLTAGENLADHANKCSLVNEFWYGWRIDRELSKSLSCLSVALRFFENHCGLDFEEDEFVDAGLFLLYKRPLVSFSVHDRLLLFNSMLHGCSELGPCLDIVRPALIDPTYFTTEIGIWHRPHLLHLLAQAFGKDCCTDDATYTGRLDALLRAAIAADSNLHRLDRLGCGMTPLMHVIFSMSRHCQDVELNYETQRWELKSLDKRLQPLRLALRRWMMVMQKSGINLRNYGKLEERAFRKHWSHNQEVLREFCYSLVEIVGVTYGSQPAEWDLCATNPYDSHLEEFWMMIEDPVPAPPGSWVEDCFPDPDSNVLRLTRKPLGQVVRVRDIKTRSIAGGS
ncbi:hypothetical protein D0861_05934 [Hortaea werneckii]|uniref:Uncharacterized protein n=1 Tax=Hortaea werneckii TaxID=91943 RepID=A0A3M7FC89_HORWE|nr:hypothetical protein D0861_05934 [Hortaea werneckii]